MKFEWDSDIFVGVGYDNEVNDIVDFVLSVSWVVFQE